MRRRDFLVRGAAGAGAVAILGPEAAAAGGAAGYDGSQDDLPPAIRALAPRTAEAPPPIAEEERAERRAKAQRLLAERRWDALFVEPGATLTYFADIRWGRSERLFGLLLPREGEAVVVCPAFERERAEHRVAGRFEILTWEEDESPYALVADVLRSRGAATGTLAVDESARYFVPVGIRQAAPALEVVSAAPVTRACRGVKSAHEVELMRFANRITLEAVQAAFASLREGLTQEELARWVGRGMARLGYPGGWVLALIGESSAYPHGAENPDPLADGGVVLVDAGTSVHGYQSDVTRTTAFGTPSAEARAVFDTVRRAQLAALEAAAPGRTAGSVDEAARRVVADAGYGPGYRTFTHRLGHGIGLEGHEWPYLVRGSDVVLEPGMSFSNEPGIYQYGKFGVRLEDIMVITEEGAELLTPPAEALLPVVG